MGAVLAVLRRRGPLTCTVVHVEGVDGSAASASGWVMIVRSGSWSVGIAERVDVSFGIASTFSANLRVTYVAALAAYETAFSPEGAGRCIPTDVGAATTMVDAGGVPLMVSALMRGGGSSFGVANVARYSLTSFFILVDFQPGVSRRP